MNLTEKDLNKAANQLQYDDYNHYISKNGHISLKLVTALIKVRNERYLIAIKKLTLRISLFWNIFYITLFVLFILFY